MPYIEVWVDAVDLDDFSNEELRDELFAREKRKNLKDGNSADYRIPKLAAKYALDNASGILRKQGQYELAFKLDEIKVDFVDL